MPKVQSLAGGTGHIPLLHPPPMAAKLAYAALPYGLLPLYPLIEHPPYESPGYTPVCIPWVVHTILQ